MQYATRFCNIFLCYVLHFYYSKNALVKQSFLVLFFKYIKDEVYFPRLFVSFFTFILNRIFYLLISIAFARISDSVDFGLFERYSAISAICSSCGIISIIPTIFSCFSFKKFKHSIKFACDSVNCFNICFSYFRREKVKIGFGLVVFAFIVSGPQRGRRNSVTFFKQFKKVFAIVVTEFFRNLVYFKIVIA